MGRWCVLRPIEDLGLGLSCLLFALFVHFIELHKPVLYRGFFLLEYVVARVLQGHLASMSSRVAFLALIHMKLLLIL